SGWGGNYFFPYSYAATMGMLLLLAALAALLRERQALACALLVAATWTKLEYAFCAIVLVALFTRVRTMLAYALSLLVVIGASAAAFGITPLHDGVLPRSLLGGASAKFFYGAVSGLREWPQHLAQAARGALLVALFAMLLAAWERKPRLRVVIAVALLVTSLALANDTFFRGWLLLQLALIPFAWRARREPFALLLAVALCTTSRIPLNLTPAWYGFVFALPVELLIVYVLFAWLPSRGLYSQRTALLWLPLFALLAASALVSAHALYAEATEVVTPRGTIRDRSPQRARELAALLAHLRHAQTLAVLPEGIAINYLANVPTPLRYTTFTPAEIAGDEAAVVRDLAEHPPQYVVLAPRDVREFGSRGFGADYAQSIVRYLAARYAVDARFGSFVVLRLKTPPGTRRPDSLSPRTPAPTTK
ncbi:MAG TPA: hypothetical protein VF824_13920, partial [Thermoanaerobaculia bacterium]